MTALPLAHARRGTQDTHQTGLIRLPRTTLVAALASLVHAPVASADTGTQAMEFDRRALAARGLDPALAELFRHEPRFAPGTHRVTVTVNGRTGAQLHARFGEEGQLLADMALLRRARLRWPASFDHMDDEATFDLRDAWPQAVIRPEPGTRQLHLVVPEDALDDSPVDAVDVERGGIGGLLNYTLSSSTIAAGGNTRTSYSAYTETGFNAAGWMFRSRQSMSADPGGKRLQFQDSYIERSLPRRRALLRLGHVSSANPLFTGIPINGVLLVPESALAVAEASAGALVEGIASSEARIEIHQAGVLLHTTLVPPGPFSLSGFSLSNSTTDLDVTVHEHDGERSFVVPASSFSRATLARPGKTFAAGQLRDTAARLSGGAQVVVTGSNAWRVPGADAVASSGFLLAGQYRAVAIGFDQIMRGNAEIALSARLTAASSRMGVGYALDMRANTRVNGISAYVGMLRQSANYAELYTALQPRADEWLPTRTHWQAFAGLGFSTSQLGSFNVSWSPRRRFDGQGSSHLSAGWSHRVGRSLLTASVQSTRGGAKGSDRSAQLSWALPLGNTSVRSSARQSRGTETFTVDASGRLDSQLAWRTSVEHIRQSQSSPRFSVGAGRMTRRAHLSGSASHSQGNTHINLAASGGLALHRYGLIFSPQPLQDTFGIAQVDRRPGVRLETDAGSVWTNRRGFAAIPRIRPYVPTRVQVDGTTLPSKVDVHNAVYPLHVARGAVPKVQFRTQETRRVYVLATLEHGQPLEKGKLVLAAGQIVSAVAERGRIFIPNVEPGVPIEVQLGEGQRCTLELALETPASNDAFFEQGTAICRP